MLSLSFIGEIRWEFYLPVSRSKFRMFVDIGGTSTIDNSTTLTLAGGNDGLTSMDYFSGAGPTHTLGDYDNFTVGFKTNIQCNW